MWQDVVLDGAVPAISIRRARVLVDYKVIEKVPKSRNSVRTLPLDAGTARALRAMRDRQVLESMEAGPAYSESGYVVVDALGQPVHPETFTDLFLANAKAAGCPRIRLHDGRHTGLSLMDKAGVPISIISAWAGHYDAAFTMSRYVHARADDLTVAAEALAQLYSEREVG